MSVDVFSVAWQRYVAFACVLFALPLYAAAAGTITINDTVSIQGDLTITGALSKGSGTFVIDHPLDPKNKLLYHSFVESPDVMGTYVGRATLDAKGSAVIELPGYFMALNKDYRYFATPIGTPMPKLHMSRKVRPYFFGLFGVPVFAVAGGTPGGAVSWMVTGVRQDPYILANPIVPEVAKDATTPYAQGVYVHPDVYGANSSTE